MDKFLVEFSQQSLQKRNNLQEIDRSLNNVHVRNDYMLFLDALIYTTSYSFNP
jgi:hypothetical protein